jgi:hypothetical protein
VEAHRHGTSQIGIVVWELVITCNIDECEEYGEYVCFKCLGYAVYRIVMYGDPESFNTLACSCG